MCFHSGSRGLLAGVALRRGARERPCTATNTRTASRQLAHHLQTVRRHARAKILSSRRRRPGRSFANGVSCGSLCTGRRRTTQRLTTDTMDRRLSLAAAAPYALTWGFAAEAVSPLEPRSIILHRARACWLRRECTASMYAGRCYSSGQILAAFFPSLVRNGLSHCHLPLVRNVHDGNEKRTRRSPFCRRYESSSRGSRTCLCDPRDEWVLI